MEYIFIALQVLGGISAAATAIAAEGRQGGQLATTHQRGRLQDRHPDQEVIQHAKIPFGDFVSNIDELELTGNSAAITDGYLDEAGYFVKRPGLTTYATLPNGKPIDGLYWWDEALLLIAVSNGNVYKIDTAQTVTLIASSIMASNVRPIFATIKIAGANRLAMTSGASVYYTDGSTATLISDAQAPTAATHIVSMDQYLVANTATDSILFSVVGDVLNWEALDFVTAERKPDAVVAIHTVGNELVFFGFRSIEFFYNDGVTPFTRMPGGEVNMGTVAPYSIQYVDNQWIFMNENRQFVRMVNKTPEIISSPIDKEIQTFTAVADCTSDICLVDGRSFYVAHFPTAGKTLVYDYRLGKWYRWGKWNTSLASYDRFLGNAFAYNTRQKVHYVGSRASDGLIYSMGSDIYLDGTSYIRPSLKTGFLDHGTLNRKRSNVLMWRGKRGVGKNASNEAGTMEFKYRNEEAGHFANARSFSTGVSGDFNFVRRAYNLGQYRARQYEWSTMDNIPFSVGDVEEVIDIGVS
jgi:hypothetical protein